MQLKNPSKRISSRELGDKSFFLEKLGDKSSNTKFHDKKIQETKKLEQKIFQEKNVTHKSQQKKIQQNLKRKKKKQKRWNGKRKMEKTSETGRREGSCRAWPTGPPRARAAAVRRPRGQPKNQFPADIAPVSSCSNLQKLSDTSFRRKKKCLIQTC